MKSCLTYQDAMNALSRIEGMGTGLLKGDVTIVRTVLYEQCPTDQQKTADELQIPDQTNSIADEKTSKSPTTSPIYPGGEMLKPKCKSHYLRNDGPIHTWFGLSYASYFCVPRIALSGMPIWWQKLFIWLVEMLPEEVPNDYHITRRTENGRFRHDPWADYRHSRVEDLIEGERDAETGI